MWWLLAGCASVLEDRTPYVESARVLAVRAEPAEALPGAEVRLRALYADATGALAEGEVEWSWCVARKPLAELGPVAEECLQPGAEKLLPIGVGLDVTGALPDDGCSLFGPNPPPPDESGVAGRPVDPDVTGGYYQPVVGFGGESVTLAAPRLRCGLANVSQEVYVAWNLAYHDNQNPDVLELRLDGQPLSADGEPPVVTAGQAVALTLAWPECPIEATCGDGVCSAGEDLEVCAEDCAEPVGCGGAETYVRHDPDTGLLETRREAISVAWFTTDGVLAEARGGREGDDPSTTADNTWTAPDASGEAWIGVVLRDERGGVGYAGYRVRVEGP